MHYHHEFVVRAPLAAVAAFHSRSASMGAITPPPIMVRIHHAPPLLGSGDQMAFTLWMGPLPIRWLAQIEEVTPTGFVDRQLRGPFAHWVHRHTFVALDESHTRVVDDIEAELSDHWFWRLVGLNMWAGMPLLFGWRAWRTRRLLEGDAARESSHKMKPRNTENAA